MGVAVSVGAAVEVLVGISVGWISSPGMHEDKLKHKKIAITDNVSNFI